MKNQGCCVISWYFATFTDIIVQDNNNPYCFLQHTFYIKLKYNNNKYMNKWYKNEVLIYRFELIKIQYYKLNQWAITKNIVASSDQTLWYVIQFQKMLCLVENYFSSRKIGTYTRIVILERFKSKLKDLGIKIPFLLL